MAAAVAAAVVAAACDGENCSFDSIDADADTDTDADACEALARIGRRAEDDDGRVTFIPAN